MFLPHCPLYHSLHQHPDSYFGLPAAVNSGFLGSLHRGNSPEIWTIPCPFAARLCPPYFMAAIDNV
jgi:hypothetical protein